MADNKSVVGGVSLLEQFKVHVITVQILVVIFLCINMWLIVTFLSKDFFYTTMRYILFAVTLMSDTLILIMSDILLILDNNNFNIQVGLCVIFCIISVLYIFVTPVTLTAMTLERYVAICMPLRHAELCSTCSSLHCILIIHGISSVPCIVVLSSFVASASHSYYTQVRVCSVERLIFHTWQGHLMSAISQLYFFIMFITIVFSYVKIMNVAKAASGESKKSTWKGLRTVILHAFQLLLCLIQMWCPFIEAAVFHINLMLYINVRYFNYVTFILAPRCLSPLIYGLRDEKFLLALKHNTCFGLYVKNNVQIGFV